MEYPVVAIVLRLEGSVVLKGGSWPESRRRVSDQIIFLFARE